MELERHPATAEEQDEPNELDSAQMWFRYYRYPYLLAKVAFFGAIVYGLLLVLQTVDAVLIPVLVSLLVAYLLDPTIDWFEERGVDRTIAILIFILIGGLGAALFALVLYPTFANSLAKVIDRFPQVMELLETKTIPWVETTLGYQLPPTISEALNEYQEQIKAQIPTVASKMGDVAGGILSQTGAIVASVLNLVMIPIFTFYFLRDFDRMRLACVEFIPISRRDLILDRIVKMDTVVGAWFRGQVNVALILAVLYSIGLGTVFGVSGIGVTSGVAVGLLTGLLNIIPYFGVLIGVILSVLLVLIDFSGLGPLLGVAAVFTVVQVLEGYVITPKIVGEAVGLSPVVVIIVLLLGGEMLGLMGVLLAIPVAGVVKVLLPDIIDSYKESPFFTGDFGDPDDRHDDVDPPPDGPETRDEPETRLNEAEGDSETADETTDEETRSAGDDGYETESEAVENQKRIDEASRTPESDSSAAEPGDDESGDEEAGDEESRDEENLEKHPGQGTDEES